MSEIIKILLLEDNLKDQLLIKQILVKSLENVNIHTVGAESELLSVIKNPNYDFAIVIFSLAWANGIEIYRKLIKHRPDLPIIMLAGDDSEEIGLLATEVGISNYLIKSATQLAKLPDIIKSMLDEKDRKSALMQSEILNKTIIQNVSEAVVVIDLDSNIVAWNPLMEKISGLKASEVIGKNVRDVHHTTLGLSDINKVIQSIIETGKQVIIPEAPFKIIGQDETQWFKLQFSPLTSPDQTTMGIVGTFHDITDMKAHAEARELMLAIERKRATDYQSLHKAAISISTNLEITQVLEVVAKQMMNILDAERCRISDLNIVDQMLTPRVITSIDPEKEISKNCFEPISLANHPHRKEAISKKRIFQINQLPSIEDDSLRDFLFIPLISSNRPIGLIELSTDQKNREYTDEEINLASVLSSQAAVALENANLYEDTRRQVEELRVLHAIANFGSIAKNVDDFIAFATEQITKAFYPEHFGVLIYDPETDTLWQHPSYNVPISHTEPISTDSSVSGHVVKTKKSIIIGNISELNFYFEKDSRTKSEICVPILIVGEVLGVLNAESPFYNAYNQDDERLLSTLAGQIGQTIQRIRTREIEQRQAQFINALNTISREIAGILEPQDIKDLVTQNLVSLLDYFICAYLSPSKDGQSLVLESFAGRFPEKFIPFEWEISTSKGIVGAAYHSEEIVLSTKTEPHTTYQPSSNDYDTDAIAIPIISNNEVMGIIFIETLDLEDHQIQEISALTTLADQLAVALEKASLYKTEKQQREQAETLQEVSTILNSNLEKATVLELILQQLKRVVNYDSASVLLVKNEGIQLAAVAGNISPEEALGFEFDLEKTLNLHPIIYQHQTYLIEDTQNKKEWITAAILPYDIRSWIGAPLLVRGTCIGTLNVDGSEPNQFSEVDAQIVSTFAHLATNALENARLFEETNQDLVREQQFTKIIQQLSISLDFESVMKEVVKLACQSINADSGSLGLINQKRDKLEFQFTHNPLTGDQKLSTPKGVGIGWEIVETGEPILIDDYKDHSKSLIDPSAARAFSFIGVPIFINERPIGALAIYNLSDERIFSQRDFSLIKSIGQQIGLTISNSRLYKQTKEAVQREKDLHHVTSTINSPLDLESLLQEICKQSCEIIDGTSAALVIFDPKTHVPNNLVVYNEPEGGLPLSPDIYGKKEKRKGLMWDVIDNKEPLLLEDYSKHPKAMRAWKENGYKAMVAVPMYFGKEGTGTLSVLSNNPDKIFTQRDLDTIDSVGRQAASAIQNAVLFDEIKRRSEKLSALYEIALATGSILDTRELLNKLQEKVKAIFNPDSLGVFLYDSETEEYETLFAYEENKFLSDLVGKRFHVDDGGLTGFVLKTRKPLLIENIEESTLPAIPKQYYGDISSWLGVPFVVRNTLVGAISIQSFTKNSFSEEDSQLLESMSSQVAYALENARLYEELEDGFMQTILALANAVDVRDSYTHEHSLKIANWAQETAAALNCTEEEITAIRWASLLHDIGKIGIPDKILHKPSALTEEEYELIKEHPTLGANIIAPVKKLKNVEPIIRCHQEKFDGTGYPAGLKGEEIPLAARILTVVDSYSAITDERIYRTARSHKEAIIELKAQSGKHFDPKVVKTFIKVIKRFRKENK